jgi:WD40 repeat protein
VVSTEFKLIFLNEFCKHVRTIDLSVIRLVNFIYFDDRHELDKDDRLVCSGIDGTFIFDFVYKSKYNPKLSATMGQQQQIKVDLRRQQPLEQMLKWNKGMRIDETNDLIITWTEEHVSFNELRGKQKLTDGNKPSQWIEAGQLVSQIRDMVTNEEKITDVLVFADYRYFVVATTEGNLHVCKFERKTDGSKKLIQTLKGHNNQVSSIQTFKEDPSLFLSASKDGTCCVWSIKTLSRLYQLENPVVFDFIQIL